jgi:hypothetical protein
VLTCVLPVTRLVCIRDWRSGFVAGVKFGYDGVSDTTKATTGNFMQVCSTGIYNQTSYDLSVNSTINTANNNAPAWYKQPTIDSMVYPANAAITQVIVLHAANPWGSKFGNIPAILFGYQTDEGINFAVCGNPVYAAAYLNPARAAAAPTPVTLKAVYNSPLSEDDELTVLGGFEGKCSTRGTSFSAFLGGDPHKSSKFFIKALKKVCFTKASESTMLLEEHAALRSGVWQGLLLLGVCFGKGVGGRAATCMTTAATCIDSISPCPCSTAASTRLMHVATPCVLTPLPPPASMHPQPAPTHQATPSRACSTVPQPVPSSPTPPSAATTTTTTTTTTSTTTSTMTACSRATTTRSTARRAPATRAR